MNIIKWIMSFFKNNSIDEQDEMRLNDLMLIRHHKKLLTRK
jgi:hypothetical protein